MKFNYVLAAALTFSAHQVMAGGPIDGCLQTHIVVAGDSCEGIASNFHLTSDEFYGMNPGLHHAGDHLCDNLDDGKKYCVCVKEPCVAEPASGSGNATAPSAGNAPSGVNNVSPAPDASSKLSSSGTNSSSAIGSGSSSSSSSSSSPNASSGVKTPPVSGSEPSSSSSSSSSPQKPPATVERSVSASSSSAAISKLNGNGFSISMTVFTFSIFAVLFL